MKWFVVLIALAFPALSFAANGAKCTISPPSTNDTASTINNTAVCIDVCDYAGAPAINGELECGPIWIPLQNASSTTFRVIADASDCPFDSVDIIVADTSTETDATGLHVVTYGTLDDDSGCGASGTSACNALVILHAISGYVYIDSNSQTVGGASCTSFKIRMTQSK